MVHHREGAHRGSVPRKAVVSAARRGNWRVYHDHGYLEYGRARPGEGGDADRHFPARSGVLIELFGLFGMEKTDFTVRKLLGMAVGSCGNCSVSVGITIKISTCILWFLRYNRNVVMRTQGTLARQMRSGREYTA